jgi:metallophosphoesterase superfamily enzyme
VSVGDLTHRAGPADREGAREFFAAPAGGDPPVVCVSGNHDPVAFTERVIEPFEGVVRAPDRVVVPAGLDD